MADKEKILRYYRSSGDGELAARLLDLAEGANRSGKCKVSEFLDPYGYSIAETVAAHFERLELDGWGGYDGAERRKAAFTAAGFFGKADFKLAALLVKWDERYYDVSHRDALGALTGLGVKREALGDILIRAGQCKLIVDGVMAEFVRQNLLKIGPAPVAAENFDLTAIEPREEKMKEVRATVASARLDAIAAAGFGASRSRVADDIAADKVKVNWQPAKGTSQPIKAGDVISLRGRGRVEVCEFTGQTRKGRLGVVLKRFL